MPLQNPFDDPYYSRYPPARLPCHAIRAQADGGLDSAGDYVARRLVQLPMVLNQSDRPVNLVMNFGDLEYDDATAMLGSGYSREASHAVLYNAPGASITVAGQPHGGRRGHVEYVRDREYFVDEPPVAVPNPLALEQRRVRTCERCFRRQLVFVSGYCYECSLDVRDRRIVRRNEVVYDSVRYVRPRGPGGSPGPRPGFLSEGRGRERERERWRWDLEGGRYRYWDWD